MKKPMVDDTTTCCNKFTIKHAATSSDKDTIKQRETKENPSVEGTTLLEKKTQIFGRMMEKGDFRLRMIKKITLANK